MYTLLQKLQYQNMSRDVLAHYNKQSETYEPAKHSNDTANQAISLPPNLDPTATILDNACGPGIVTEYFIDR